MASRCPHCGSSQTSDHECPGLALIGQVLDGRYEIQGILGHGGMGTVFRAQQSSVRRSVAVKTLHPSLASAPTFFERFRREAEVASQLRHPNVITVYDFGRTQDGTCYYVMELLPGESLKQLVKREGALSLRRAMSIIQQVARGLAHAHDHGCVHRDLKPHNIMLQPLDGHDFVKVLDFGLVKALRHADGIALTSAGQVLGTPQYMAPEQASGDPVDARADLYSLAGVFFFALTGTSPFGARSVRKALVAAMTQAIPEVNTRRRKAPVPPDLDAFFRKGLALDRAERFQSAEEFLRGMRAALAGVSDAQLDALPAFDDSPSGGVRPPPLISVQSAATVLVDPADAAEFPPLDSSQPPVPTGSTQAQAPSAVEGSLDRGGKLRYAALGMLMLAALGATGWWYLGRKVSKAPPAAPQVVLRPEPPPPALPLEVSVELETQPTGASIFEDDVEIGQTPVRLHLPRSAVHQLIFRLDGHQPVTKALDFRRLTEDRLQRVLVKLSPEAPKSALPQPPRKTPSAHDIKIFD